MCSAGYTASIEPAARSGSSRTRIGQYERVAFVKRWLVRLWDEFEEDLTPGLPFYLMGLLLLLGGGIYWLIVKVG